MPAASERALSTEQKLLCNELERKRYVFRGEKSRLEEKEYYDRLEKLLVEVARFYQEAGIPSKP